MDCPFGTDCKCGPCEHRYSCDLCRACYQVGGAEELVVACSNFSRRQDGNADDREENK